MAVSATDLDLGHLPILGGKIDYGIGAIGAGFIMRDVHLAAYREAGFNVVAIASRTPEHWFPQAFIGTMGQLMRAIEEGTEPEIGGRDNLRTMALIEAAYASAESGPAVALAEIPIGAR